MHTNFSTRLLTQKKTEEKKLIKNISKEFMKNHKIMQIFSSVGIKHETIQDGPGKALEVRFIVMLNKALKED